MKDLIGLIVLAAAGVWLSAIVFMIVRDILSDRRLARSADPREKEG